jgi:hypothetical protein
MLPTEDLFVYVYVLIDDLVAACGVPEACPACELQRCATGQR